MKSTYSNLMQSKYFSPAFNSAIFDGPVRIYFAQFHEAFALKLYFIIQNQFKDTLAKYKSYSRHHASNLLVMVYPTTDHFVLSFENQVQSEKMCIENWNQDVVLGLSRPLDDQYLDLFAIEFSKALQRWIDLQSEQQELERPLEI
jgi:hypothetical protein